MPKMQLGGSVKTKSSLAVLALRGAALYAFAYACYWGAAYLVGSPHEFRHLWAKSLIPLGVVAAAMYFNKTNQSRGN